MKTLILGILTFWITLYAEDQILIKLITTEGVWQDYLQEKMHQDRSYQEQFCKLNITLKEEVESAFLGWGLVATRCDGAMVGRSWGMITSLEEAILITEQILTVVHQISFLTCLNEEELKQLYHRSVKYHMLSYQEKIAQEGLRREENIGFLLEYYRAHAYLGGVKERRVKQMIRRKKTCDLFTEWEMTVIAAHVYEQQSQPLKQILQPVYRFLRRFEKEDCSLTRQAHLLLSEIYARKRYEVKAALHLQKSLHLLSLEPLKKEEIIGQRLQP
ncbi:MAG: hypothetical protein QRY72_00525 [Candidatus Rhabdochlamydia sp.]